MRLRACIAAGLLIAATAGPAVLPPVASADPPPPPPPLCADADPRQECVASYGHEGHVTFTDIYGFDAGSPHFGNVCKDAGHGLPQHTVVQTVRGLDSSGNHKEAKDLVTRADWELALAEGWTTYATGWSLADFLHACVDLFYLDSRTTVGDPHQSVVLKIKEGEPPPPPEPTVWVEGPTSDVAEGGAAVFRIRLSEGAPAGGVSVSYRTLGGTAYSPSDYSAMWGTQQLPTGALSSTVTVRTTQDTAVESREWFSLRISNPTGATLDTSRASARAWISDTDVATVSVSRASAVEGGTLRFDLTLSQPAPSDRSVSVRVRTTAGTAESPGDFWPRFPRVEFPAGAVGRSVEVNTVDDDLVEGDETFTLQMHSPQNLRFAHIVHGGLDDTATGTIIDNDEEGAGCAAGTHDDGAGGCHDDHPTENTCIAGETYTVHDPAAPGGHRTETCPDDDDCPAGSHDDGAGGCHGDHPAPACALTSGQTYRVHPDPGDLSQHEDRSVDLCVLSAPSVTVPEDGGPARVTFRLSGPAPRALAGVAATVETGSGDGAATAGDDFTAVDSAGLTFAAGATASAPISVDVIDDTEQEPSERFGVAGNLPDLENGTAAAPVTILDNDNPDNGTGRVYTGAGVTVTEGETATVRFTVAPPPEADDPVSGAYATVGTALTRPDIDFVAVSGTVTFTDAADTVDVDTIDDDDVETLPDIVTVSVTLPGGDTVEAQITILDNDSGTDGDGGLPFEDPNPPVGRNCPTPGTHGHDNDDARGWYCHDDHGETSGCADVVQVSTVTDHYSWLVDACNYTGGCVVWNGGAVCWPPPPEPPCPSSFHYHGGYCHDHNPIPDRPGDEPLDCLAGRAQQYNTASHRTGTVKACPPPTSKKAGDADAGLSRLIVFAGEHLILRVEVDVTSPHVLTTRRLRVVAVNGCDGDPAGAECAEPGTHFELLDIIISFNPSTPQPVEVQLKTLVDADHGTELRQLKFVISDPDNLEMDPIERSAWVEPPLRGTQ